MIHSISWLLKYVPMCMRNATQLTLESVTLFRWMNNMNIVFGLQLACCQYFYFIFYLIIFYLMRLSFKMKCTFEISYWDTTFLCYLWLNIQDGDHALCMDLPNSLKPGSIHSILMAAVLQVVIVADVLHHLVMRHKVVVLPVLLVLLRRTSRVWVERQMDS